MKPGEYLCSCPLNPTPDYPPVVREVGGDPGRSGTGLTQPPSGPILRMASGKWGRW